MELVGSGRQLKQEEEINQYVWCEVDKNVLLNALSVNCLVLKLTLENLRLRKRMCTCTFV